MNRERQKDFFDLIAKDFALSSEGESQIYGFLTDADGSSCALWKGERNYIMSDSGKTFENLSGDYNE